jgi:hypothetical protein
MESNHPNHNDNRFTVCPATPTVYQGKKFKPTPHEMYASTSWVSFCFQSRIITNAGGFEPPVHAWKKPSYPTILPAHPSLKGIEP